MSALHEAVARAIASAPMTDNFGAAIDDFDEMAAAAIRVMLAEATQSIEAHRAGYETAMRASTGGDDSTEAGAALDVLAEVLAILAGLGRI